MTVASPVDSPYRTFFIRYAISSKLFIVDTEASVSVWPPRFTFTNPDLSDMFLYAVNPSTIKTYGQISLGLDLPLHRDFK